MGYVSYRCKIKKKEKVLVDRFMVYGRIKRKVVCLINLL